MSAFIAQHGLLIIFVLTFSCGALSYYICDQLVVLFGDDKEERKLK